MQKNSYKLLSLLILTIWFNPLYAQSEESAVKEVVSKLFEGMRKTDTAMIRSCFAPGALLQTAAPNREGKVLVYNTPVDSFVVSIGRPRTEVLDERIQFGSVLIDDNLASVWTPYNFYLDNRLLHCGVNSFQLVKLNGSWKIQYLIDTRRRKGCQ